MGKEKSDSPRPLMGGIDRRAGHMTPQLSNKKVLIKGYTIRRNGRLSTRPRCGETENKSSDRDKVLEEGNPMR